MNVLYDPSAGFEFERKNKFFLPAFRF